MTLPDFQKRLEEFKLKELFNELGWDRPPSDVLNIQIDDELFKLTYIAQKRGVAIFLCTPNAKGEIPLHPTRLKIEKKARQIAHEHLLIFTNGEHSALTWLWVLRAPGQPTITRTHTWHRGSSGEPLLQKLRHITWSIEEEEAITLAGVITGMRKAFDRERISKRFYDHFKREHQAFSGFIEGMVNATDRAWYASLMLNRLMFIYFIQRKGFLDNNINYLSDRLKTVGKQAGAGHFHTFYRCFLRDLFHEGLGKPKMREQPLDQFIGNVPYLNGGLFDRHELEASNPNIDIPDKAFENLFQFFDSYDWHLDDRPLKNDKEINPDVLGYIFEKYINQKQMGAYYTKEDITQYISKSTVIPHLLERARERCKVAFEGEESVWSLLRSDPDRYLYEAMKRGVIDQDGAIVPETALPDFVQAGMSDPQARMLDKRYNLGEAVFHTASKERGTLPTETWREYIDRRTRCLAIRRKLAAGEVSTIDALITLNLDIRQFMQDIIETCTGPQLLRAIWQAIVGRVPVQSTGHVRPGITVLDPTCGSGAFLFAALNILEPLYEACLDRMAGFIDDARNSTTRQARHGYADFAGVLEEINRHPSRSYYIYKSIILHNLYGVDIMAEAVEICKLRLFLKLVSQVDHEHELEPLPDIDFNIRTGNALVGFATEAQFDESGDLASDHAHKEEIKNQIRGLADEFDSFREKQTRYDKEITRDDKQTLRERLSKLNKELDHYMAQDYAIKTDDTQAFAAWQESHQPFHWFAQFYGVMREGGFDVVIGNPPYVELSNIDSYRLIGFQLKSTGNLFSICTERFMYLMKNSWLGVIVPISAVSTPRMDPMMKFMEDKFTLWVSNFSVRPAKLFTGVDMNLSILIGKYLKTISYSHSVYSTGYNRWNESARQNLFPTLSYGKSFRHPDIHAILKTGSELANVILSKIQRQNPLSFYMPTKNEHSTEIYYHAGGRYFRKCFQKKISDGYKKLAVKKDHEKQIISLISSSLYYWYWLCESDCWHVTRSDILKFPVHPDALSDTDLIMLGDDLLTDIENNAIVRNRQRKSGDVVSEINYYVSKSKDQIDLIDLNIARHCDLTDDETDFIINYDIKYRMGSISDKNGDP